MDTHDNAEALSAQSHGKPGIGPDGDSSGGTGSRGKSRGGRRGGGRGGRSGGGFQSREKDISHALSKLLRHRAAKAGIALDKEGFAPLDRVLQWGTLRSLQVTVAEVRDVVANNDKQRFAWKLRDGLDASSERLATGDNAADFVIRANQGHSIASVTSDAGLLTPIDDAATAPAVVCHGTYFSFWPAIEASGGLKRMTRNHVHMGCVEADADTETKTIPGLRRDAQLMVYIDVRRALREDPSLKWWRAANSIVLSEGNADGVVPAAYFQRVVTSPHGSQLLPEKTELLLWEDGKKVADLPADVLSRARAPHGKAATQRRAQAKGDVAKG